MARTLLIVVVIILLLGALPAWPYSMGWGYYPAGGLGSILNHTRVGRRHLTTLL